VVVGRMPGRILFAGFDAGGGCDPDDGDEGDQAKRHERMLEGERDRYNVDEEGEPVLALDGSVFGVKFACVAQAAADGQTEKEKTEASHDHGRDVNGDREGVHLLFENVRGEEGEQREAEEEAEVGVEDEVIGLFGAVNEVVMVDPIDPDEGKGDEVKAEGGENGANTGEAVLVGDLELKHHDGDDDGDDSVGEGFEAGWGRDVMGHGFRKCLVVVSGLAEAYNGDRRSEGGQAELESRYGYYVHGNGCASGFNEGRSCGLFA
jgi:hypothetical protein